MWTAIFKEVNDLHVEEVAHLRAGAEKAEIRVTQTAICDTDLHILRDEYPV
jgi:D-arabinose 1-dehydrogenase-like Zn-dependent alcohol dehydrogenase